MISDSSPIIFLSKIGRLNILKSLFKEIYITSNVKEEVLIKDKAEYRVIENALQEGLLKVKNAKNEIKFDLGMGEQSAISLAIETGDNLIIDDLMAIKITNSLGIKTLRTTSVIFLAVNKNLISKKEAEELINALIREGYYIKTEYYAEILKKLRNLK